MQRKTPPHPPKKNKTKQTHEIYQNFSEERKEAKDKKKFKTNTKILLKKKRTKGVTITRNLSRSCLSIEKITI